MDQRSLSSYFPRLAGVFFVLFSAVMVFATATMQNPVSIKVSGSGGSSTAGNKWNCLAQARQVRTVQFHSFTVNGNSYQRTLIDQSSLSMYFTESGGQVVQKNFTATDLGTCLLAAGKAGVDAIGFNNSVCSGYTMKTNVTMCPCSSGGDTVLFVNKNMISDKRTQFNTNIRNVTKTTVYSDSLAKFATLQSFYAVHQVCLDGTAADFLAAAQFFVISGSCYYTLQMVNTSYSTSCFGTPVVVLTRVNQTLINILDSCGTTVTVLSKTNYFVPSHAGYGFTNYPQPATATDCGVTFVPGPGTVGFILQYGATLASSGTTCIDELVIYNGTDTSGAVLARSCNNPFRNGQTFTSGPAYVVFKRQPAVAGASAPFGSYIVAFLY